MRRPSLDVLVPLLVLGLVKAEWKHDALSEIGLTDLDIAKLLDEEAKIESRDLQENDQVGDQQLGERCGRRTFCAAENECTFAGIGNRCAPKTCLIEQLAAFQQSFDMKGYMDTVMAEANLSEEKMQKAYEESNQNARRFYKTPEFQALWAGIEANPEPKQRALEIFETCMGSSGNKDATVEGHSFYYGLHMECGAGVDTVFAYFTGSRFVDVDTGKRSNFARTCIGGKILVDD